MIKLLIIYFHIISRKNKKALQKAEQLWFQEDTTNHNFFSHLEIIHKIIQQKK